MLCNRENLLHLAVRSLGNPVNATSKVQYLCEQCPALIHQRDKYGYTPLHSALEYYKKFNFELVKIICGIDETAVRNRTGPTTSMDGCAGRLPLHCFIRGRSM